MLALLTVKPALAATWEGVAPVLVLKSMVTAVPTLALMASIAILLAGCHTADSTELEPPAVASDFPDPVATRVASPPSSVASETEPRRTATPDRASLLTAPASMSLLEATSTPPAQRSGPRAATVLLTVPPDAPEQKVDLDEWLPKNPVSSKSSADSRVVRSVPDAARRATISRRNISQDPGVKHTWQDGERTMTVWLQPDLLLQDNSQTTDDDIIVSEGAAQSIVMRRPGAQQQGTLPVFRAQGQIMTLPGGVLLVLDREWTEAQVDSFFTDNGITRSLVEPRTFASNAFLIETAPGFPSLDLANALAGLDGVVISSPNWQIQVEVR